MTNITKIFVTVMVMTALFIPAITVDAAGAVLRDARINLGGSYFGATGLSNPTPAPTPVDTGVALTDIPATGIELNGYTVTFALIMLLVSIMIAGQVYTLKTEAEKNRKLKTAIA